MFCAFCGTRLVSQSHFCHNCGKPVAGTPAPAPPAPPKPAACFMCHGSGKVHRSTMPHSAGCIFCTTCPSCSGSGVLPGNTTVCPKCQGEGRYHDSPMPHNPPACFFCKDCPTCHSKGWIS